MYDTKYLMLTDNCQLPMMNEKQNRTWFPGVNLSDGGKMVIINEQLMAWLITKGSSNAAHTRQWGSFHMIKLRECGQ